MPNNGAPFNKQSEDFLNQTILAALEAGDAILEIYQTEFTVDYKQDDSPLTQADRAAHAIILRHLQDSNIPILSEEGKTLPVAERRSWQTLWIVDPLDGTKEFIKRNGEFTINIALMENNKPVLGSVYVPVLDELYWAIKGTGAFVKRKGITTKLEVNHFTMEEPRLKVTLPNQASDELINKLY